MGNGGGVHTPELAAVEADKQPVVHLDADSTDHGPNGDTVEVPGEHIALLRANAKMREIYLRFLEGKRIVIKVGGLQLQKHLDAIVETVGNIVLENRGKTQFVIAHGGKPQIDHEYSELGYGAREMLDGKGKTDERVIEAGQLAAEKIQDQLVSALEAKIGPDTVHVVEASDIRSKKDSTGKLGEVAESVTSIKLNRKAIINVVGFLSTDEETDNLLNTNGDTTADALNDTSVTNGIQIDETVIVGKPLQNNDGKTVPVVTAKAGEEIQRGKHESITVTEGAMPKLDNTQSILRRDANRVAWVEAENIGKELLSVEGAGTLFLNLDGHKIEGPKTEEERALVDGWLEYYAVLGRFKHRTEEEWKEVKEHFLLLKLPKPSEAKKSKKSPPPAGYALISRDDENVGMYFELSTITAGNGLGYVLASHAAYQADVSGKSVFSVSAHARNSFLEAGFEEVCTLESAKDNNEFPTSISAYSGGDTEGKIVWRYIAGQKKRNGNGNGTNGHDSASEQAA